MSEKNQDDRIEHYFDEMAAATGCPTWDYPLQVVRWVKEMATDRANLVTLLRHLRGWDHLATAADGPYWSKLIDEALAGPLEIGPVKAGPFRRSGDPGSCPYRTLPSCSTLGVVSYCKLEEGHDKLLGHDYDEHPLHALCVAQVTRTVGAMTVFRAACGQPLAAHGTPHATESATPYHLAQWAKEESK
jgi:hypothetical protein